MEELPIRLNKRIQALKREDPAMYGSIDFPGIWACLQKSHKISFTSGPSDFCPRMLRPMMEVIINEEIHRKE